MVRKPVRLFTDASVVPLQSTTLTVRLYRFCDPKPRGHHSSYADGSSIAVPVIVLLELIRFVKLPDETVSFVKESLKA